MRKLLFIILVLSSQLAIAQTNNKIDRSQTFLKKYLNKILTNLKSEPNVIGGNRIIIRDKAELIGFIEPVLFNIYGKSTIENERPYQCYLIGKYWIAFGYLPTSSLGGTFEVVIDRTNLQIIYIMHGK